MTSNQVDWRRGYTKTIVISTWWFQKGADLTFPDPWSIWGSSLALQTTLWRTIHTHKFLASNIFQYARAVACVPDAVCSRHLLLLLGSFELNDWENPPGFDDCVCLNLWLLIGNLDGFSPSINGKHIFFSIPGIWPNSNLMVLSLSQH